MATHSSILACEILWTEEPGGLQISGLQRTGLDLATNNRSSRRRRLVHILPLWTFMHEDSVPTPSSPF